MDFRSHKNASHQKSAVAAPVSPLLDTALTLSLSDVTNNQSPPSSGAPSLGSGEMVETLDQTPNNGTQEKEPEDLEMNNPEEQLPEELNLSNDAELHQALIEFTNPNLEGDCTFRKILNHSWNDGVLMLKAQCVDPVKGNFEMDMPLKKPKKDEPLACTKYIREYIAENRWGHRPLNEWASQTIELHSSMIRRIARMNPSMESLIEPKVQDG